MIIDLTKSNFKNVNIKLNHSKSLYIRYLFAHFVKYNSVLQVSLNEAEDILIAAKALNTINANAGKDYAVVIDIVDCGTVFRFLTALLAVTKGKWLLVGTERLLKRPINDLTAALSEIGANFKFINEGIEIIGKNISKNEITINCEKSSQFASALILIAPLLNLKKINIIPSIPSSISYIRMTESITNEVYNINCSKTGYFIENDWSAASFWYCCCSLIKNSKFTLSNLRTDTLQGDSEIIKIFNNLNVATYQSNDNIIITNNDDSCDNKTVTIDLSNNLDLFPTLAIFFLLKNRCVKFTGLKNLNNKESQRLSIIISILLNFAKIETDNVDYLSIAELHFPKNQILTFNSHNDHRIAMACSLFALFNKVIIDDIDCVKKSYPMFIENLIDLEYEH